MCVITVLFSLTKKSHKSGENNAETEMLNEFNGLFKENSSKNNIGKIFFLNSQHFLPINSTRFEKQSIAILN